MRAFRARGSIVALARLPLAWQNHPMAVPVPSRHGAGRAEVAPALFRLLAESALSRAALDACGMPVCVADAVAKAPGDLLRCPLNRGSDPFRYRAAGCGQTGSEGIADAAADETAVPGAEAQALLRAQRRRFAGTRRSRGRRVRGSTAVTH